MIFSYFQTTILRSYQARALALKTANRKILMLFGGELNLISTL